MLFYVAYYNTDYEMWFSCVDPEKEQGMDGRNGPWEPAQAFAVLNRLKSRKPDTRYVLTDKPPNLLNRWNDACWSKKAL